MRYQPSCQRRLGRRPWTRRALRHEARGFVSEFEIPNTPDQVYRQLELGCFRVKVPDTPDEVRRRLQPGYFRIQLGKELN